MTATPPPGQPATPAAALRRAADRLQALRMAGERLDTGTGHDAERQLIIEDLRRWADELDTAPAAPCCTQRDGYDCEVHSDTKRVGEPEIVQMEDLPDDVQERAVHRAVMGDHDGMMAALREGVDQVHAARASDPGPAAPTAYRLPAEPPPEVTELWAADGGKAERNTNRLGGWWYRGMVWPWEPLLRKAGPLSTVPPAGTGADR